MPFSGLPRGFYGAIVADPPWAFRTYSGNDVTAHRTEEDHYSVMSLGDLKRLPVGDLAAKSCALFLWVVDSHLDQAFEVGRAWGFRYKTRAFEWIKVKKIVDGNIGKLVDGDIGIGMGYWSRKQTESCLLFTRGSPKRLNADVRQVIIGSRRQHSRKPDEQYARIERLVAGPYLELFARYSRRGWDGWGDEMI
jgi:N6-adenosine-specific RNA methylase IME4